MVRKKLPWRPRGHPGRSFAAPSWHRITSPRCHFSQTTHQSQAGGARPHPDAVLTLRQVQDGPRHLQPLVPVDHLQPIQEVHDVGFLLRPVQLQPPPAPHCEGDTTTTTATGWVPAASGQPHATGC